MNLPNSIQQPRQDQQTKTSTIKRKIAEKQARSPSMSFASAWAELQREQPSLFEDDLDPATPVATTTTAAWRALIEEAQQTNPGAVPLLVRASGLQPQERNSWGVPNPPEPKPQSPLSKRISELMELNPGLDLKTAMEYLRNTESDLFPESEQPEAVRHQRDVRDKVQALKDAIDLHRKANPHHDFAMAYQEVTKDRPELIRGLSTTLDDNDDDND